MYVREYECIINCVAFDIILRDSYLTPVWQWHSHFKAITTKHVEWIEVNSTEQKREGPCARTCFCHIQKRAKTKLKEWTKQKHTKAATNKQTPFTWIPFSMCVFLMRYFSKTTSQNSVLACTRFQKKIVSGNRFNDEDDEEKRVVCVRQY